VASASYQKTVLVSDTMGFNAMRIDSTLVNAWGIAINPNGIVWISSNGKGLSEVYDKNGVPKRAPVNIPSQGMLNGGVPSGAVFNKTTDFVIPATMQASKFIFADEDGKLYAWSSGDTTHTVVDRSAWGAVYKGLEIASDGGANFIYATDFHNGKIDVFDMNFHMVTTKPFMDSKIPMGFAPFNIRLIDSVLFVTYAKQQAPDNHDDQKGPGNGFVNVFKTDGTLIRRFATRGKLNSPWGIEKAPEAFGQGKKVILIGNFGDGHINVYDELEGEYLRTLKHNGMPVWIDGLWAITFPDNNIPGDNPNKLYFTAGPDDESHSLFGYLMKQ
ncbi:MAG TPA: TIGR03118 family protein, partial [Bacteroidales bacterium]